MSDKPRYKVHDYLTIYCGHNEGCCFYVRAIRRRDDGKWEYDTGSYGWREEGTISTEGYARLFPMSDEMGLVERLNEEAERLSGHSIDRGSVDAGIASNLASEAAAAIERLVAERDEAREALKPFAKYGELHAGQRPEFVEIGLWAYNSKGEPDGIELKSRDFFRARQALGEP